MRQVSTPSLFLIKYLPFSYKAPFGIPIWTRNSYISWDRNSYI